MELTNVILPFHDPSRRWDIRIQDGKIQSLEDINSQHTTSPPNLLLPPLCHPHIHLDKAYLLTCNHPSSAVHPDYSDLVLRSGTFEEALTNTSEAKKRYTTDDLYLRGSQLLATSYKQGVTSLRAFVELDHVTGQETLRVAIQLKERFAHLIDVQICAFAQDPIFSTEHGEDNRSIIETALRDFSASIDVIGTTPYVEAGGEASRRNIKWAVQTALKHDKHLDFHIEYNLQGGDVMSMFDYVVDTLIANAWPNHNGARTVVLGHATRLSQATHRELVSLAQRIKEFQLPIHFIGLPTSDLFMMGRPASDPEPGDRPINRPCGTLNVPKLIQRYGLNTAMSVNNVGNAFTPYGTGDPLALACWGVGIYHSGTEDDAKLLYEAVSLRAREAIMPSDEIEAQGLTLREGAAWTPMLLFENETTWEVGADVGSTLEIEARPRLGVKDIVWDPPETRLRRIIH